MKLKITFLALLAAVATSFAVNQDITLHWDTSPEPGVQYKVYRGTSPGVYTTNWIVATGTTFTTTTIPLARNYYVVTAFVPATYGGILESDFSNEVVYTNRPGAPTLTITVVTP
jgi:hypothetical protein